MEEQRPQIKDWINYVGGAMIAIVFLYGSYKVLATDYFNMQNGLYNMYPYIPTLISTVLLIVVRIITMGDVATNMCVLLVFLGLGFLIAAFFIKSESVKNGFFGAAGSLLGLGMGVPFGESLKRAEEIFNKNQKQKS